MAVGRNLDLINSMELQVLKTFMFLKKEQFEGLMEDIYKNKMIVNEKINMYLNYKRIELKEAKGKSYYVIAGCDLNESYFENHELGLSFDLFQATLIYGRNKMRNINSMKNKKDWMDFCLSTSNSKEFKEKIKKEYNSGLARINTFLYNNCSDITYILNGVVYTLKDIYATDSVNALAEIIKSHIYYYSYDVIMLTVNGEMSDYFINNMIYAYKNLVEYVYIEDEDKKRVDEIQLCYYNSVGSIEVNMLKDFIKKYQKEETK